jgi:hypothetical protein
MNHKIEILPYKKGLLDNFIYDGIEITLSGEIIIDMVDFYSKLGSSFVGIIDGKVLGVGGLYPLWKQSGSCYLFLNKEAAQYKKSVFKVLQGYMTDLIKQYDIKILIVECIENVSARTLINHLGFKKAKDVKLGMYLKGDHL